MTNADISDLAALWHKDREAALALADAWNKDRQDDER